jgi:hypothetical protein
MPGVFVTKGMTVGVPPGGLTVSMGPGGELDAQLVLQVRFDVCPTWVELALRHLEDAVKGREERIAAWAKDDPEQKAATLEREFEASMQAVMAAAIAVDAFYAMIQPHVKLPTGTAERWRTKRTARYVQVTEVIRRGFKIRQAAIVELRKSLKEIYRVRDMAVHPSGRIEMAVVHPELDVGVEWRFALFRSQNAEAIVNGATWLLWQLASTVEPRQDGVRTYVSGLRTKLGALFPDGHPLSPQGRNSEKEQ